MTAQSMTALQSAHQRRQAGFATRRGLAAMPKEQARQRAADLILDPAPEFGSMRVRSLLQAIPRTGAEGTRLICRYAGVSRDDRLEDLTGEERDRLAFAVRLPRPALRELLSPVDEMRLLLDLEAERVRVLQRRLRELRKENSS